MLEDEIELLKSLEQIQVAVNLDSGESHLHPLTRVREVPKSVTHRAPRATLRRGYQEPGVMGQFFLHLIAEVFY